MFCFVFLIIKKFTKKDWKHFEEGGGSKKKEVGVGWGKGSLSTAELNFQNEGTKFVHRGKGTGLEEGEEEEEEDAGEELLAGWRVGSALPRLEGRGTPAGEAACLSRQLSSPSWSLWFI